MLPLLILAGAGLAFFAFSGGNTKSGPMPPELIAAMDKAVKSGDPIIMRTVAKKVRAAGYESQAASLEAAADNVVVAIKTTPQVHPGTKSGKVNPAPKADSQQARSLAGKLAGSLSMLTLAEARTSADVRAQTLAFQAQEKARGFYVGNLDGDYGPRTALALATDHGIIPPHPLKWPKRDVAGAKANYKAQLAKYMTADPQRAEEWAQASAVDND